MVEVLDDEGRLFGIINIIDALVVLLVLAVMIAGIALVAQLGSEEGNQASRYATIELGEQPTYIANEITAGEEVSFENQPDNLTITDVYRTHGSGDIVSVTVRAELHGTQIYLEEQDRHRFEFNDDVVRGGDQLTLATDSYTVQGTITTVGFDNEALAVSTQDLLVESQIPLEVARQLETGDTYQVGEETIATIKSLQLYPSENANERYAILGLSVWSINRANTNQYANTPLSIGASIPFQTNDYRLSGNIIQTGSKEIDTETIPVVIETTTTRTTADTITTGDAQVVNGQRVATVATKQTYPTNDPSMTQLRLGLDLTAVTSADETRYAGQPLRLNTTVPFATDSYAISGNIVTHGSHVLPGEPSETTVTLKLNNIPPETANSIQVGMTETQNDVVQAEITDKQTQPAVVVLESNDGNIYQREHPVNKDLTLTIDLQTRETATGRTFHARELQESNTIVLDLGSITIEGTVTTIHN